MLKPERCDDKPVKGLVAEVHPVELVAELVQVELQQLPAYVMVHIPGQ